MELTPWKKKIQAFAHQYKYPLLILIIGIVLLLLPSGEPEEAEYATISAETPTPETLEERLENILSMIQGAGKVRVVLSVAAGEEYLYQTDSSVSTSTNGSEQRNDTVTVTDENRNNSGLVRQINPPVYQGAVIVCQGADNPAVRLAITQAVSRLTGLGTDRITVLKMK